MWKLAGIFTPIMLTGSLIAVVIQIQKNTKAIKGATYQQIISNIADIESRISQNEDVARLYEKSQESFADLEGVDKTRANEFISSLFNAYENLFYQK